jgi:hypothetical protein
MNALRSPHAAAALLATVAATASAQAQPSPAPPTAPAPLESAAAPAAPLATPPVPAAAPPAAPPAAPVTAIAPGSPADALPATWPPGAGPSAPPSSEWVAMPPGFLETPGLWPRTIPFDEERSVPPGYRLGTEPRRGMWVTGLSIFASTYGLTALVGGAILSEDGDEEAGWLLLPVVGPVGFGAQNGLDNADDRRAFASMTLLAGAQTAGLTLLIVGLVSERKVFKRNDVASAPEVRLVPTTTGAALVGRF